MTWLIIIYLLIGAVYMSRIELINYRKMKPLIEQVNEELKTTPSAHIRYSFDLLAWLVGTLFWPLAMYLNY